MKQQWLYIVMMGILLSTVMPSPLLAAQPLILASGTDSVRLGGSNLDILEDTTGTLTIADVTSPRYAASFKQSQQMIPNFGISDSAFWFRFTVTPGQSDSREWLFFVNNPLLDEAALFVPASDGSFMISHSGIRNAAASRAGMKNYILLPLPAQQGTDRQPPY